MSSIPPAHRLSSLLGTKPGRETLVAGAQIYVNFLSLTRRSGWLQAHISKQTEHPQKAVEARAALLTAASRHLAFMEMRRDMPTAVPTRDISVAWAAELKRPTALGTEVGPYRGPEEANRRSWYDHQQHRLLQSGGTFESAEGPPVETQGWHRAAPYLVHRWSRRGWHGAVGGAAVGGLGGMVVGMTAGFWRRL